jgi:tripartite-type tricarboxylate transporter receptor subunit TctC
MSKKFVLLFASALSGWMFCATAQGQANEASFPNKPLRLFAAFPAGGVADIAARIITPGLSQRLGQPVVVDNRAGAGGVIGVESVAKAPADGYTLGIGTSGSLASSVTLMPNLPYSPTRDLVPISKLVNIPIALVVHPSLGVNTLSEFLALAKTKPKQIYYGTAGNGTTMHLAGELLNRTAKLELVHSPYKGTGPATVDLLAGHITAGFLDLATVKPHLESGRLKALAVTSAKRSPVAPELPTFDEAGVPGYKLHSWIAVVMRSGTPPEVVKRVNADLVAVLKDPKVHQALLNAKLDPDPTTSEQLRDILNADIKQSAELIRESKISLQQ